MCQLFILALGKVFFFVLKKKKEEEANNNNITNIAPAIPRKRKIMYPCLYAVNKFRGIRVKSWRGLGNEGNLQLRSGKQWNLPIYIYIYMCEAAVLLFVSHKDHLVPFRCIPFPFQIYIFNVAFPSSVGDNAVPVWIHQQALHRTRGAQITAGCLHLAFLSLFFFFTGATGYSFRGNCSQILTWLPTWSTERLFSSHLLFVCDLTLSRVYLWHAHVSLLLSSFETNVSVMVKTTLCFDHNSTEPKVAEKSETRLILMSTVCPQLQRLA